MQDRFLNAGGGQRSTPAGNVEHRNSGASAERFNALFDEASAACQSVTEGLDSTFVTCTAHIGVRKGPDWPCRLCRRINQQLEQRKHSHARRATAKGGTDA